MESSKHRTAKGPGPISQERGARLIAFDGGGVKGISALMLLDAVMEKVKDLEIKYGVDNSTEDRLPSEYFHLAAGTSTGGLIAVMLFRLHMTVKQAMVMYQQLAADVFSPRFFGWSLHKLGSVGDWFGQKWIWLKFVFKRSKFDDGPLRAAIDRVIQEYGLDDEDKAQKGKAPLKHPGSGKILVCATLADKGESILFRSYDRPDDAKPVTGKIDNLLSEVDHIDISTAARATSAAPMYLPQVEFPEGNKTPTEQRVVFWDGGLLNNNPIDQLWNARYDLVGLQDQPPPVALVVSLGCSWCTVKPDSLFGFVNTLTKATGFMTNTEAKNRDFQRYVNVISGRNDMNNNLIYKRLNTPTGDVEFDLADFTKMGKLETLTAQYLTTAEAEERISAIVNVLVPKPSS